MSGETIIVVDVGSASTKAGFSGCDIPDSIFPAAMTKWPRSLEVIDSTYHLLLLTDLTQYLLILVYRVQSRELLIKRQVFFDNQFVGIQIYSSC